MATLETKDFTTLTRNMVAAMQAKATKRLNLNPGSVLLAIVEATSAMALWLQALILKLLAITRAATSKGADLDSWMADFGLTRLAAVSTTGSVTFARFSNNLAASVPVGTTVQTTDGTQNFAVIADATNTYYNAVSNAYIIPALTSAINVPVRALIAGIGGNIAVGSITVLTSISGVDTVSNGAAFANGIDAEKDGALRLRFVAFLASLSRATKAAVAYAVQSVQQGLTYTLTENQDYGGATHYGFFYVVVDDGTGMPPSGLLTNVANAIEAYRGLTINFAVFAPIVVTASVGLTITTASGYDHPTVVGQVGVALTSS